MSDCIGPINIIPDNNQVVLLDNNKSITVIDNNCCTNVNVTQPITSVVQVLIGPIGPAGTNGINGLSAPFTYVGGNVWNTTSSIEITGSFTVSGSNTFRNIGPAQFTGSVDVLGNQSIFGNNGYILLTPNVGSPNLTVQEIHANDAYPWIARFYNDTFSNTNSVMSYFGWDDGRFVFHNDSTQSIGLQVNGYSAENGLLVYPDKVAFVNNVEVTGSINLKGGSLVYNLFYGGGIDIVAAPGEYVELASSNTQSLIWVDDFGAYIQTSGSYYWAFHNDGTFSMPGGVTAPSFTGSLFGTASYASTSTSASYALTASYSLNGGGSVDTGSLVTTASFNLYTGSNASQFAGTSSYALTASYVLQAVSSSFATTASYYGGSVISASYASSSTSASYAVSSSQTQNATSASYALTASYVANASSFPFTGSAIITGSLIVTGSTISTLGFTGSLLGTATTASYVLQTVSASYVTLAQTASYILNAVSSSYASTSTSASYAVTSSYSTYAATAGNGGVTKILAGANINLSPINGLGDVTVTSFGNNLYNTATGSYGSFFDTGSVLAASTTTIYSMSLNTTDISNGVFISASNGDNTRIKFTNAGTYNVQFSSQFSNTDNSNQDVVIWVKKNGVDIPDSSGVVSVPPFKAGSNGQVISGWNYFLNLSANDFIQMCWHVEQANVITLETIAAGTSPTHPRTPSLILTANRIDTFLSNTGSFTGSFAGDGSALTGVPTINVTPSTNLFNYYNFI